MGVRRVGYIAVGVDRTGGALPELRGSAVGAQAFAIWLEGQKAHGVEVFGSVLTDVDAKSVSARDIQDAASALVDAGGLDLMVLFFSGHGIVKSGNDEQILLSDVHKYSDEAISIAQTLANARFVGIPHVVVISDACRNAIDPYSKLGQVAGKPVFNRLTVAGGEKGKVDVFYATEASQTAKEHNGEGFFTKILLETLTNPPARVRDNWPGIPLSVIPAWKLEEYLAEELPRRAYRSKPRFDQTPDFIITSREPHFLGLAPLPPPKPVVLSNLTGVVNSPQLDRVREVARNITVDALIHADVTKPVKKLTRRKAITSVITELCKWNFEGVSSELLEASGLSAFYDPKLEESFDKVLPGVTSGYAIIGGNVDKVLCFDTHLVLETEQTEDAFLIKFVGVNFDEAGCSILVLLKGGTMFALPVMPAYLGRVGVTDGLVRSISFELYPEARILLYEQANDAKAFRLRRAVAASLAAAGQIQHLGRDNAQPLALILRETKRVDPTLGIYASYAYSMADNEKGMRSVFEYFRMYHVMPIILQRGAPIPFDVAMLGGAFESDVVPDFPIQPFCPMMSLGWSFLPTYTGSNSVHKTVLKAGNERLNSEWTTFLTANSEALIRALEQGEIG